VPLLVPLLPLALETSRASLYSHLLLDPFSFLSTCFARALIVADRVESLPPLDFLALSLALEPFVGCSMHSYPALANLWLPIPANDSQLVGWAAWENLLPPHVIRCFAIVQASWASVISSRALFSWIFSPSRRHYSLVGELPLALL
jgi:hypothetical protein